MAYFFGIDIGGSNIKIGLVDSEYGLLEKVKYPTRVLKKKEDFVAGFSDILKNEFGNHPEVEEIGIGVPGTISRDARSTLELPNLGVLGNTNLLERLENYHPGKHFYMDNDAHVAALGEYYFGKEKVPENYVFITLGTGVGGAAIIDHHIFRGGDGNPMEIGHIMSQGGKTLEQIIGKAGLKDLLNEMLEKNKSRILGKSVEVWDTKQVLAAAREEDKVALKVFKRIGVLLGEALVSTIRLLDIKTIIVGGGISQSYNYVINPMEKVLHKNLTPYYTSKLEIKKATLANEAGIVGAASLCFK